MFGKRTKQSNKAFFKRCKEKTKIVALFLVFALIWGQTPVGATVNDNLSSTIQKLIGSKTDTVGDSYENSSLHAKLNQLEKQTVAVQAKLESLEGQNAAYSLYCYIQSSDTRYEGCELTLTSASGNQVAIGNLHLDERLKKYVTNI